MTKQGKDKSQKQKSDATPQMPAGIHIGISDEDRAAIAKGLSALLADTYTLYLTTHNFHWNVTGPMFNTLHTMFMAQYTELWNAVDPVAERIRALGHHAPGSYAQFGKLTPGPVGFTQCGRLWPADEDDCRLVGIGETCHGGRIQRLLLLQARQRPQA